MRNPYTLTTDARLLEKYRDFPATDPHCHTVYSDGCVQLRTLVKLAKKRGFRVVTKADHNTTKGNTHLARIAKEEGLLAMPGIEISTKQGHMVGFNIMEWSSGGGQAQDVIEKIHQLNGAAIMAHPWWKIGDREHTFTYKDLDGFEGVNHSSPFGSWHFIRDLYPKTVFDKINPHRIPVWAGSDSHAGVVYGHYRMIFLTTDISVDGIMECILKGNVIAYAPPHPVIPTYYMIADGWINQPVQLKNVLFYRHTKKI
jgi:predicted metal-dependent phosphoesterase TrpH